MFDYAIIVAVIVGIVEVVKQFLPSKFMPLASIALGVVAGIVYVEGTIESQIFVGLAMGLAACGLFDVTKLPTKKTDKTE